MHLVEAILQGGDMAILEDGDGIALPADLLAAARSNPLVRRDPFLVMKEFIVGCRLVPGISRRVRC